METPFISNEALKKHSLSWFKQRIGKPVVSITTKNDFIIHNEYHATNLYWQQENCGKFYDAYYAEKEYGEFFIPRHLQSRGKK